MATLSGLDDGLTILVHQLGQSIKRVKVVGPGTILGLHCKRAFFAEAIKRDELCLRKCPFQDLPIR